MTRAEEDLLVEDSMILIKNKDEQIHILKCALEVLSERSAEIPKPYSSAVEAICQIALALQKDEAAKII